MVFDTKQVAFVLRRQLELEEHKAAAALTSTNLRELTLALMASNSPSNFDPLFCPKVRESADGEVFDKSYGNS